jgi:multidrug efflux pump subunit AcrA (membrane-fusion protein)
MQDVEISTELVKKGAEGFMEGQKKQLELKKASLQVTVSTIEKERDKADVGVKTAKLEAARVQQELRRINAQRTGVVNQVVKRQYSYVRAGEPILNLTSMEKIRITGTTPKLTESPHLLLNAPARVIIRYAEGKSETVDGTVTFVSPKSDGPNQYKLHVDLPNRLTPDGQYLFRDGMVADIEVKPRSR